MLPKKFLCVIFLASAFVLSLAQAQTKSQWVRPGLDGKLVYKTTPAGDRIMDFSYAGYRGGGVALPVLPVRERVAPPAAGSDATALIQAAIDRVSALAPDANGFRGAVLLEPGEFVCERPIMLSASGVVLRGSGSEASGARSSVIRMTGGRHTAIVAGVRGGRGGDGGGGGPVALPATVIADDYVASGAMSFNVENASGFRAGDVIEIRKPVTREWVRLMEMHDMVRDGKAQTWIREGSRIDTERVVASVAGNRITLRAPLSDSFDSKYLGRGGVVVAKIAPRNRLRECGIESLRIACPEQAVNHSQQLYDAVRMNGEDLWMRDVVAAETMNSIGFGGQRITVQRVSVIRKARHEGASKPAEFAPNAGQILLDRCVVEGDNVWFVALGGGVSGPVVVLNSTFNGRSEAEGHQRWTTGVLFDSCSIPDGIVSIKNRGSMGSGHGWALGWSVAWNCVARGLVVQQPPGAFNWAIGCSGERILKPRPFQSAPNLPEGTYDAHGGRVTPGSLYLAQLLERCGPEALRALGYESPDISVGEPGGPAQANRGMDRELGVDLARGCPVGATSERKVEGGAGRGADVCFASRAIDGNDATYWAAESGRLPVRWELDTNGAVGIDTILLREPPGLENVRSFRLEGQVDSDWKLLAEGTTIGARKVIRIQPVIAWKVRLTILQSEDFPALAQLGLFNTGGFSAQDIAQDIALPKPNVTGGMPLMEAVSKRKSDREFSSREIPLQLVSDMLWAAVGINRPESGRRTYPSASNRQGLDVYAAMQSGFYRYDSDANVLRLVVKEDLRSATGKQGFTADSPMTLVYVGDFTKWSEGITENSVRGMSASVGAVCQNVYLYCASAGLNGVVRGCSGDIYEKGGLDRKTQRVMLAHTIGFPKGE